jgi:glycolate oxidase FAD binding subunit
MPLGNLTSEAAVAIRLTSLQRILDYQPADMTLSVEAGARLADVQAVLAEHGQMLPIEAPLAQNATIGGLLATALSGPRRYGGGSLRDVIIGIQVAYPDGTLGKAGGLVVKNVSGFDMMRVHYGAMGTLGIITSANFKVLPLPRSEFTVLHECADLSDVSALTQRLRAPQLRPMALVVSRVESTWQLAARYEGRETGLRAVATSLGSFLDQQTMLEGGESSQFWSTLLDRRAFTGPTELRVQVRALPANILDTMSQLIQLADGRVSMATVEIEPGLGLATLTWTSGGHAGPDIELIGQMRVIGDVITIQSAPDAVKRELDVWGEEPGAIAIMRRIKNEYDPHGVLNPGRFVGRI